MLDLAGGLLPTATLRHIEVQRTVRYHEKQTMLSLDIPEPDDDAARYASSLTSFPDSGWRRDTHIPDRAVQPGRGLSRRARDRPGRYSYHAGMRVTDLISSFKDLAARAGQPICGNHPSERARFSSRVSKASIWRKLLADPASAPFSTRWIRFESSAGSISKIHRPFRFSGDVRGPGTYRTSGEIPLSDAVHLAGGIASGCAKPRMRRYFATCRTAG